MYIIGVDIGTTSTKAIAYDPAHQVKAFASYGYEPVHTVPGHHELDPEAIWQAVINTVKQVRQQMGDDVLTGCSFSSAMHSLLVMDEAGKPLTQLITWADNRSSEQAAAIKASPDAIDIYSRTGTPIHPMSPLCKLRWMREQAPDLFSKGAKFIGIKEYIFFRLFGEYIIDHSVASATGLFDIYNRQWHGKALAMAGITADKLSKPVPTTYQLSGLHTTYAELLNIPADIPFIVGASDGCLANLGSGAIQPGDVSITVGTSGAVRMTCQQPQHDPQQRIFNYILTEELYVSGGPVNNGAVLLKWCTEQLFNRPFNPQTDTSRFIEEAGKVPAGAEGLIFLPYVQGERAPVWDAQARGVFFGIGTQHIQAHFMRAVIEGINYSLYDVARSVAESIGPVQRIIASGGFTYSPQWVQWLADLFGQEIEVSISSEASAIGAAWLGLYALGITSSLELPASDAGDEYIVEALTTTTSGKKTSQQKTVRPFISRFHPSAVERSVYLHNYSIYKTLYTSLKQAFHQ